MSDTKQPAEEWEKIQESVKEIRKQNIIQQYCIDLYDGKKFVGSYFWWNEI